MRIPLYSSFYSNPTSLPPCLLCWIPASWITACPAICACLCCAPPTGTCCMLLFCNAILTQQQQEQQSTAAGMSRNGVQGTDRGCWLGVLVCKPVLILFSVHCCVHSNPGRLSSQGACRSGRACLPTCRPPFFLVSHRTLPTASVSCFAGGVLDGAGLQLGAHNLLCKCSDAYLSSVCACLHRVSPYMNRLQVLLQSCRCCFETGHRCGHRLQV